MARKKRNEVVAMSSNRYDDNFQKKFEGNIGEMIAMSEFLKEWEDESQWLELTLSKMLTAVESGGPLIVRDVMDRYNFMEGTTEEVVSSTINNGLQMNTIAGSQLLVLSSEVVPYRNIAMCLSDTGFSSLILRAGADCSAISKAEIIDKKTIIDIGLKVSGEKTALALYSYGKIRTFNGGSTYAVLKQSEMFDAIISILNKDYGEFAFNGGTFTHGRTLASFELTGDTDKILETYTAACEEANSIKSRGLKVQFDFSTSEIGDECATVSVRLTRGSMRILLGSAIKVQHSGQMTTKDFNDQLPLLLAKTKVMVEGLERLLTIPVSHPINCMVDIAKYVGLAKVQTMNSIAEFQTMADAMLQEDASTTFTAHDVFYVLQEALMEMRKAGVATTTIERCEENLSRTLIEEFDWASHDVAVRPEWKQS